MMSEFIVYESTLSENRDAADATRFEASLEKLAKVGIRVKRVTVGSHEDLPERSEAWELVKTEGTGTLPIAVFEGAVVSKESYPDDQTLADFLNVPDGVLSVDKTKPFNVNDLAPGCACGNKGDRECK